MRTHWLAALSWIYIWRGSFVYEPQIASKSNWEGDICATIVDAGLF